MNTANATPPRSAQRTPRLIAAVWLAAAALQAPAAWGFGFGEPQVSSAIGQPLRLRIPLRVDTDGELTAQCVRLIGNPGSDAVPTMTMSMARISIERKGDNRILRIDSVYPINEPILRVSVEAGCAQHARREFVLLLDPPDALPQLAVAAPSVDAPAASAAATHGATALPGADAAASLATGAQPAPADAPPDSGAPLVLGAATITGHVGEPLSLQVPVTGSGAAALEAGCVRLAGAWNGEGSPVLSQARLAVVRNADGTQIDLVTDNPITVPALRVVVEAGCAVTARREYAVVLDGRTPASAETARAESPAPETTAARSDAGSAVAAAVTPPTPDPVAKTHAVPRPPKPAHKIAPAVPEKLAKAPAQAPAPASAAPAVPAGPKAEVAARPKTAAPAADRLVLASPPDQPDPAAQRVAEMDKRIADLTREVTMLREEIAAERQRAAQSAESPARLSAGWIVAILALLGLGISGLMNLQRKRGGMPWEKTAWEPSATVMPDALYQTRMAAPPPATMQAREASAAPVAPAPAQARDTAARSAPPPPLPRTGPLAAFNEHTGTLSTLTPDPDGPQTRIEVTELHADDPMLGKMHTVFLEPGNLDAPPAPVNVETRIPGPRPTIGTPAAAEPGPATSGTAPLPPIVSLPPMPAPTVVAPEQRHGAFTFDEGPYTQTPTMLVLDLDLTTRALPPEEAETARFAAAAQKLKGEKDGEPAATPPEPEGRNGYKNGR